MKKILILDMDDVLFDFAGLFCERYNEQWNDNLKPYMLTDWDLRQFVRPAAYDKIFTELMFTPEFFQCMKPLDGAVEFMEWANEKYEVFIASSCYFQTVPVKAELLVKHFPFWDIRKFIPCYHKWMLRGDYLVDDRPMNLEGFSGNKFLMNRPHNQGYEEAEAMQMIRVDNLEDVKRLLLGGVNPQA